MEQKLIDLLKQVKIEVQKIEKQGYSVEIDLGIGKYRSIDSQIELKIYKPIIISESAG